MKSLRYAKTERKYRKDIEDGMTLDLSWCPSLKEFQHFRIINNDYPHDRIAKVHHLLIPIRIYADWREMRWYEMREFKKIHSYLNDNYDCIKLNYGSISSVHNLVHWHLYRYK